MTFSVIVNAWRAAGPVRAWIKSLPQGLRWDYEVILVDQQDHIWPAATLGQSNLKRVSTVERSPMRRRLYGARHAKNEILIFLDDDCLADCEKIFSAIESGYLSHPEVSVQAGLYESSSQCGYLSGSYNSICNMWVENRSYERCEGKFTKVLLGGVFCIRRSTFPWQLSIDFAPAYGAEESPLIEWLKENDILILYNAAFRVLHLPQQGPLAFVSRAFLHGRFARKEITYEQAMPIQAHRREAFRSAFVPAYLIHFAVMRLGYVLKILF